MESIKKFSERVYELRVLRRMTQKELGKEIGLSGKSICMIEAGTQKTTIDKLILLAKFFDVSTDYLLGLKDERK